MERVLVSIIIPVYNVEKYLRQCLDSVIGQTYKNLEIWLVDDGSKDSSGKICDEYAANDYRVNVIHKKNGGLSSARNVALDYITGKYVYFLDSDDFISNDLVAAYLEIITKYDADVVMGTSYEFSGNTNVKINHSDSICKPEVFTKIEALRMMLLDEKLYHAAAGPLFKSDLYKNIRFPEGVLYEDYATTYYVISMSQKIVYCDDKRNYYRIRQGSIMNSKVTDRDMVLLDIADKISHELVEEYPELKIYALRKKVVVNLKLYSRILDTGFKCFMEEQIRIIETVEKNSDQFLAADCIRRIDKLKLRLFLMGKIPFYLAYKISDFNQKVKKMLA